MTAAGLTKLDNFAVRGTTGGYWGAATLSSSSATPNKASSKRPLRRTRSDRDLFSVILVGGLALNLTPCVLPMIPINLAIIGAGAQAGHGAGDSCSAPPTAPRWPSSTACLDWS